MKYRAIVVIDKKGTPFLDDKDGRAVQKFGDNWLQIYRWAKASANHFEMPVQIWQVKETLEETICPEKL